MCCILIPSPGRIQANFAKQCQFAQTTVRDFDMALWCSSKIVPKISPKIQHRGIIARLYPKSFMITNLVAVKANVAYQAGED